MGRGMEMDGCGKFIQILMFLSNFILWIGSIVLLVLGIWAAVDRPYLEKVLGGSIYMSAAYILIAVGILTFIISFLGCFGAVKEIKCMLLTYFIIVLLLFIILLVGGILGLVYNGQAEDKIRLRMLQSMKSYNDGDDNPVTKAWDEAQRAMRCCGIDNQRDWQTKSGGFNRGSKKLPLSCCKKDPNTGETERCTSSPNSSNSFQTGCYEVSKEFVKEHAKYIGGAGIVVALLMIFGMVFSFILFKLIK